MPFQPPQEITRTTKVADQPGTQLIRVILIWWVMIDMVDITSPIHLHRPPTRLESNSQLTELQLMTTLQSCMIMVKVQQAGFVQLRILNISILYRIQCSKTRRCQRPPNTIIRENQVVRIQEQPVSHLWTKILPLIVIVMVKVNMEVNHLHMKSMMEKMIMTAMQVLFQSMIQAIKWEPISILKRTIISNNTWKNLHKFNKNHKPTPETHRHMKDP